MEVPEDDMSSTFPEALFDFAFEEISSSMNTSAGQLPADEDIYLERCYVWFNKLSTFLSALGQCQLVGGNLASIHSPDENDAALQALVMGLDYKEEFQPMQVVGEDVFSAWIGISDSVQEGVFTWTDQSELEYLNWSPDEPDKLSDCGRLTTDGNGLWRHYDCSEQASFICLFSNSLPIPTPLPMPVPTAMAPLLPLSPPPPRPNSDLANADTTPPGDGDEESPPPSDSSGESAGVIVAIAASAVLLGLFLVAAAVIGAKKYRARQTNVMPSGIQLGSPIAGPAITKT